MGTNTHASAKSTYVACGGAEAGEGCELSSPKPFPGTQPGVVETSVLRLPQPLLPRCKKLGASPRYGPLWTVGPPSTSVSADQLVPECCVQHPHPTPAWQTLADPHCWEPPYPGACPYGCALCPGPPTGCAHPRRLTFHSKPATARPPAAPEPASPTKRPEPSLLAKSEAPICRGKKAVIVSQGIGPT